MRWARCLLQKSSGSQATVSPPTERLAGSIPAPPALPVRLRSHASTPRALHISAGPKCGCKPAYFKDPNDKSKDTNDRKAGRLKLHLHAIVNEPEFATNCPVLFRIASTYERHAKSYIVMLTWVNGLWMHVDARASETSNAPRDEEPSSSSWTAAAVSRATGPGAKDGVYLVGHSIAGGPQVVSYANAKKPTTPQEILQLPKWRAPTDAPCVERAAGSLTAVRCWLHSGAASLCADGSNVQRVPWDPAQKETRLCHSATAAGPFGCNVSILATVSAAELPLLVQELAAAAAESSEVAPTAAAAVASPAPTSSPPPPPPPRSSLNGRRQMGDVQIGPHAV